MRPVRDYVAYVIIMAPLLNSVSGIAIDLFAPSMPAIAREFGVSDALMQGSISITLVAYAVGQLIFGLVADGRGRLVALLPGLGIFVGGSLLAMVAQNIETFLLARALQGFAVGACQVCARALLVDNVKGERFFVAIVYLSLAWGLGPVFAPFIGGLLEQYAGWRWNFALYAAYSALLLVLSLRLRESLAPSQRLGLAQSLCRGLHHDALPPARWRHCQLAGLRDDDLCRPQLGIHRAVAHRRQPRGSAAVRGAAGGPGLRHLPRGAPTTVRGGERT